MKWVFVLCILLLFTGFCCTPGTPEQPAFQLKNKEAASQESGKATDTSIPRDPLPKETGNTISGKAVYDTELYRGPATEGHFTLTLHKTGRLNGTLSFADRSFCLTGIKEGDRLRLWASREADDVLGAQRGFLFGSAQNGGYEGVFALSGNGGEPRLGGTWSATAD